MIALDNSVQAAEFEQAKANLGLAQSNYTRNVELQKKGFVADRALDESRAALEVAKANLALAQAKLAKTEIRAPFAGVIGLRQVSEGDYVKEGQDLVNFEDISSLKVDFRMPEVYLGKLGKGQALGLESDAFKGEKFTAVVDAIDPLVDQSGRAVVLRAKLKNQGRKLRPGMFVRVNLIVDGKLDALAIPEEALVPVGEEQFVFKVVDGKVVRTRVKVGQRVGAQAVIMDGLAANDVVVTGGQLKLRDGVPVKIAPSAPLRGASAGADPSQGAGPPVAVAAPAQKAQ